MPRGFNIARLLTGTPDIQSIVYTAAQSFKIGALVVDVAAGTVSECGADPAIILGVALQGAATGPGFDNAGTPAVVTGQRNEVSVALCDRLTIFSCRGVNGGTDPVIPLQTHIGETYGCAKVGNDWVLDLAEVTVMQWKIVDIDIPNNIFFVKIRDTFLSLP